MATQYVCDRCNAVKTVKHEIRPVFIDDNSLGCDKTPKAELCIKCLSALEAWLRCKLVSNAEHSDPPTLR